MKLRIRDIQREGTSELEETLPPDRFQLETPDRPVLVGPVQARLKAEIQHGMVWAWVDVRARVTLTCARCLERFVIDLSPAFDVEAPATQEYLEVEDDIRQQLILSLPVQPLCRDLCQGLCAICGKNLNGGPCGCIATSVESRFEALKNLKLK